MKEKSLFREKKVSKEPNNDGSKISCGNKILMLLEGDSVMLLSIYLSS